jgi:hypothetical protein
VLCSPRTEQVGGGLASALVKPAMAGFDLSQGEAWGLAIGHP